MPVFKNNAAGPRVFNIAGGAPGVVVQRTLAPGEAAELELAAGPDKDPVLKAWLDSKEIEEVSQSALKAGAAGFKPDELAEAQAELVKAQERVNRLAAARQSAELDQQRLMPPRQFGSDGGPQQSPTVDGNGGALTPEQEKHGRPEPTPAEAAKALGERNAAAAKQAAEDRAKAEAAAKAKK